MFWMRPTDKSDFWLAIDNKRPIEDSVDQHIIEVEHSEHAFRRLLVRLRSQSENPPSFKNALVTFARAFWAGEIVKMG